MVTESLWRQKQEVKIEVGKSDYIEGIPDLPGTPQDEAGLTRKFER